MRVGLIQSNYIPWRGYFDFIDDVDLFIFHDDIQYTKKDWRNRNLIKTPQGKQWLTVPVKGLLSHNLINEVSIDYSQDWISYQVNRFDECYRKAPFFNDAFHFLEVIQQKRITSLSELNQCLIIEICKYLDINTPFETSSTFSPHGTKTTRIIDILKKTGADVYLSGPSAEGYLDNSLFVKNCIQLEYKNYTYDPYPQQWGSFIGDVTILDLIANCGPDASNFIKSKKGNTVVIKSIHK